MCCRDHLAIYAQLHPAKFILGYCSTYIFMQTFMIPGTIFMSLLAGALFGVVRGLFLVVFNATAGASSCYFLSKLIGRPIVNWLWPEKLRYFQAEVYYFQLLQFVPTQPLNTLSYEFVCTDSKAEREVAELHALSESHTDIAKPVHQSGITNRGYTVSYLLPGNRCWSCPSLLHHCQSKTFPVLYILSKTHICLLDVYFG